MDETLLSDAAEALGVARTVEPDSQPQLPRLPGTPVASSLEPPKRMQDSSPDRVPSLSASLPSPGLVRNRSVQSPPSSRDHKDLQRQVIEHGKALAGLEDSIAALTKALKNGDEEDSEDERDTTDLNYQDSWPEVEVTVEIIEVVGLDLVSNTFDAEFKVHFDWLDSKLRRGIHYEFNAERGKFELMSAIRSCKNDMSFFNPKLVILNSKTLPEEGHVLPKILDEVTDEEGTDIAWLHKDFYFLGTLGCRGVKAFWFPFDVHSLHIKIGSPEMHGTTSIGRARKVTFAEPTLRKEYRFRKKKSGHPLAGYALSTCTDDVMHHMFPCDTDGGDTQSVDELRIIGIGGVVDLEEEKTVYDFVLVLKRNCARYFFDILIYNLQTATAMFSLFTPFDGDMLVNRMSITLTVLLTVVGVSASRPPVIEDLPYHTLHDMYGQMMVFSVLVLCLANLVVYINCFGMYRNGGLQDEPDVDYYFDTTLKMIVNNIKGKMTSLPERDWWCENAGEAGNIFSTWCSTSNMDCVAATFTVGTLFAGFSVCVVSSQLYRITQILRIKHLVDIYEIVGDKPPQPWYSRLVLVNEDDSWQMLDRYDIRSFGRIVSILPFFRWFWRCWACLRLCQKRCCPCCSRRHLDALLRREVQGEDDSVLNFTHALDSEARLREATQYLADKRNCMPSISRFGVKLSPYDTFRVLDVGSGQMGFYSYWLDEHTRCVKASGADTKLNYKKGSTFVDQFLSSSEGVAELTREIVERFQLSLPESQDALPSQHSLAAFSVPEPPGAVEAMTVLVAPMLMAGSSLASTEEPSGGRPRTKSKDSKHSQFTDPKNCWQEHTKKNKLLMGLTGANRTMLRDDEDGRERLYRFITAVNVNMEPYAIEIIPYSPEDVDEAMYELWAAEWVVQHGDLVVKDIHLSRAFRILAKGVEEAPTTWKDVQDTFGDLKADGDLKDCYIRAAGLEPPQETLPDKVFCHRFYKAFEESKPMLRSLVRSKLFSGTLSAGAGSSQVTLRVAGSLAASQVHSVPVGNRVPLVGMKLSSNKEVVSIMSSKMPRTQEIAMRLLCDTSVVNMRKSHKGPVEARPNQVETRAAWSEDGPVDAEKLDLWRELVNACAEECELPTAQRGLFVGISAIFYAAKAAGCDSQILARDVFLQKIRSKIDELMIAGGHKGRDLANLTLVCELVQFILHRSALIVCKRNWVIGEGGAEPADFAATWTLGMYLKHSGVMGIPLRV